MVSAGCTLDEALFSQARYLLCMGKFNTGWVGVVRQPCDGVGSPARGERRAKDTLLVAACYRNWTETFYWLGHTFFMQYMEIY